MAQTDRQTDNSPAPVKEENPKSIWWCVTAWNDEIELMEDSSRYPTWVRSVLGGREECPKTGKLHFQGALQLKTQMRMKAIKSWLPKAHLEPSRSEEALKKYAMKQQTAVGPKEVRVNPARHYSADELCERIAYEVLDIYDDDKYVGEDGKKKLFTDSICFILSNDAKMAGQLMNPSLRNFWCSTFHVWINHAKLRKQLEEEALRGDPPEAPEEEERHSITAAPPASPQVAEAT